MHSLSDCDLSYVAGYLDGEGCFTVGQNWKITIACENTHRETIEWLHSLFGGSLTKTKPKKENHRPTYRWAVVGNDALEVCKLICVHLKEKAPQCLLLIAIQQTKKCPLVGRKIDPFVVEERDRLTGFVKELKGRIRG